MSIKGLLVYDAWKAKIDLSGWLCLHGSNGILRHESREYKKNDYLIC